MVLWGRPLNFSNRPPFGHWVKLSLCLIVRNEAAMVVDCLASARGVADEIVVVDTGSDDSTIALCRGAGARVFEFSWCDDFAAARNHALEQVTGDWVLSLDADERLDPASAAGIRRTMGDSQLDGGLLTLHNADRVDADFAEVLGGGQRLGSPLLLLRLMRRTPDLRWRGAIHETVGDWTAKRRGRIRAIDVHLIHLGAAPALRAALGKDERNIRMLRADIDARPGDPTPKIYLANLLLERGEPGDVTAARALLERAWSLVQATRGPAEQGVLGERPPPISQVPLVHLLAQLRLATGELGPAIALLDTAIDSGNRHPNLLFWKARALLAQGRASGDAPAVNAALRLLQECIECAGRVYPSEVSAGVTGYLTQVYRAQCLLALGRPAPALEAAGSARTAAPEHAQARIVYIEALIAAGDPLRARAELAAAVPREPNADATGAAAAGSPDDAVLLALCAAALGDPGGALQQVRRAMALGLAGLACPHLAARCRGLVLELGRAAAVA